MKTAALLPLITPEFLATLRECARHSGWSNDYIEVERFVEDVHGWVGAPISIDDLEPYDEEDK